MLILTNNSESIHRMVLNSLLCIILIIATISNALLLLVFHRKPGLRTISNRFVINLLVTNLITCWILLPLLLLNNAWRRTPIASETTDSTNNNVVQCALFEGIAIGLCVACILSVLMIGIDQYFAVIDPLRYHSFIKATTSVIMIVISWTIAASFGVFGSVNINRNCSWYVCEHLDDDPLPAFPQIYRIIFSIVFAVFAFIIPFAAICWIYSSICSAAQANNRRTKRSNRSSKNGPLDTTLDYNIVSTIHESVEYDSNNKNKLSELQPKLQSHHSSAKNSFKNTSSLIVNSLRHRISNASLFRYREETRAARISALVIVMALFCWLPFTLLLLIRSPLLWAHLTVPSYLKQIGILSLCSNAVVSPLIFAHRNRRVHRELCKLFRPFKRRTILYGHGLNINRRHSSFKNRFESPPKLRSRLVSTADPSRTRRFSPLKTPMCKNPKKCGSILNRIWRTPEKSELDQCTLRLPEVALETDTSRSSFSSNASGSSNPGSISAASFSDIAEAV